MITKLGDVFGPPVNLAARLTALARRNRILVDRATVARLPAEDFDFLPLTAREMRGFGLVEPVAVRRRRLTPGSWSWCAMGRPGQRATAAQVVRSGQSGAFPGLMSDLRK